MRRALGAAIAIGVGAFAAACGSSSSGSSAARGAYAIDLPSVPAAALIDSVQVFAYAATDASSACVDLLEKRRTLGSLPAPLVTASFAPCSISSGGGDLSIDFGAYALVAVAQSKGTDLFLGCAVDEVTASSPRVTIELTLASPSVDVPPTTCPSLADRCAGKC